MPSIICFEIIPSGTFALPTDNPSFGSISSTESTCHIFKKRDAHLYIPCKEDGTPLNVFKLVERFAAAFQHMNYSEEAANKQKNFQTFIHILAIDEDQQSRIFSGKKEAEDTQSIENCFKKAALHLKSIDGGKRIITNIASLTEHKTIINEDNILISFNLTSGIQNKAFYLNIEFIRTLNLSEEKLQQLINTMQTALSLTNYRKHSLSVYFIDTHCQLTGPFQSKSNTLLEKIKNSLQFIESSSSPSTDDTIPVTPSPEDESTSISAACPSYHSLESSLENPDEPVVPDTPLREPELSLSNSIEEESSERAAKRQKTSLTPNAATFFYSPSSPFKSPRDPGKDTAASSSPDTRLSFKH